MKFTQRWTGQNEVGFEVYFARKASNAMKLTWNRLIDQLRFKITEA